jgi:hypothetical protein
MAGYSATPLVKKLGIKPGASIYIEGDPVGYFDWISPLPARVEIKKNSTALLDFIHLFVTDQKKFRASFTRNKKRLQKDGIMWISWPKKSSGVLTDLDENEIRDFGLKEGLVDVKVCAVDETWSGLKFVYRTKDR